MRNIITVITICCISILTLTPCCNLISQDYSKFPQDSILNLYTKSTHAKDSCTLVLLNILDTLDVTTPKNLVLYHKIVSTLSSNLSNEHVANYFLDRMTNEIPYPMWNTDKIYDEFKNYPFLQGLVHHSTWGMMKPLINYLSVTRTKEDLLVFMAIIETITSKRISEPVMNMLSYYGNEKVDTNLETIRMILKN